LLLGLVLFLCGCGFTLNRNRITLPENATSISLQRIENSSFTPGLDFQLKELLIDRFATRGVRIQTNQTADLSLSFQINSATYSRRDYSLDSGSSSYEFIFTVTGKLTVINNASQTTLFSNQGLSGRYSLKSEATDLSQSEITDGRQDALENLSDQILKRVAQDF